MSTINPFEPPRTTDLDGRGSTAPGHLSLSDQARQELVAAAPWVRWLTRLTSLSIAVTIVRTIARFRTAPTKAGILFVMAVGTALSIMILRVLRRYAAASDRLRAGERSAASQVIDAQASYFKLVGVLFAIGVGLLALLLLVALAGRLR